MYQNRSLVIGDVVKRPLFQDAEVVAGERGLYKAIRWVHILEGAESADFLNGGELILSTGIGFGENARKRLNYLHEIIARKAVGLCVELGPYIPEIPADMRELADHHEFPLIAFHKPVRFVDITLDLHQLIVNGQNHLLQTLEGYSRDLQRLTFQPASLARILNHLQANVNTQTVFLSLHGPSLFIPTMPQIVQNELLQLLQTSLLSAEELPQDSGLVSIAPKKVIVYQPIMAMGHVLAYLGIILYEREPDEFLSLILDYTTTALAQILVRKLFLEEKMLDNQTRLLDDILHDKITQEEQILTLLGIQPNTTPTYLAVIMEIDHDDSYFEDETDLLSLDMLAIIRSILSRCGYRPLLLSKRNRLYLLLLEKQQVIKRRQQIELALLEIKRCFRQAHGAQVSIRFGVSRASKRYAETNRHFQEAEQVIAKSARLTSPFFEDLGIYRLLIQIQEPHALVSFAQDYLEPLLTHDAEHGTQLVHTLRHFLLAGCSKQDAAERLYIRRQTLYQRLEKIGELLGDSYLSPERRICLEVALHIHEWLRDTPCG